MPISSNLLKDYWPNHAHLIAVPVQTTCLALGLSASLGRWSLRHPPPFHELIPGFWIHHAWWPLTP
jgi:hypothetical protein